MVHFRALFEELLEGGRDRGGRERADRHRARGRRGGHRPGTADLVREAEDVEGTGDAEREPLFEAADRDRFGESWTNIRAAFVDDPATRSRRRTRSSPS